MIEKKLLKKFKKLEEKNVHIGQNFIINILQKADENIYKIILILIYKLRK